ncbi:MAG: winged helix-turn-helix transcriptional regulator [Gemmatimonadales bacterium]
MPSPEASWRSRCPINVSLEIFGDRWSLLVVRDLLFGGPRSFSQLLDAQEGIATNVLTDRLQRLEAHGIVERHPDPKDGRRGRYLLTPKGLDLAPILIEMVSWGARYEDTAAPPAILREIKRDRESFLAALRERRKADRQGT